MTEGWRGAHPVLCIVVPCYNEEPVLREVAGRLSIVLRDLVAAKTIAPSSFIYFVDDGSTDKTWAVIIELHQGGSMIKGLKLARNAGHQNAVLAGLLSVRERADCVISMDADLQHDEQAIHSFLEKYNQGADVVYGVRNNRLTDSYLKKGSALFFYKLMRLMGVKIIINHADYRLISRKVLDALSEYREFNLFLRGIVADIGFKSAVVPFDVRKRFAGKSKYSLRKMASFALDGITSFSVVPLRLVTVAGLLVFIFSCLMTAFILLSVIRGRVVPGWASTVIPIYFIGGIQIIMMGLIGEYIGKIYQEVKARPRFIKDIELF
jgi:glycosyltransferase involved in cell wall biosynthesis